MFADSKQIKWLLENKTHYFIWKNSGVPQSTISDIKNGKKKLENISFENASKLTELAIQEQNSTQD